MKPLALALLFTLSLSPDRAVASTSLAKDLEILKTSMRLAEMWNEDQAFQRGLEQMMKKGYSRDELMKHPLFGEQWRELNRANTGELKRIVAKWGWPTISLFGAQADEQAYVLVLHADQDIAFQEECLNLLAKALGKRDTHPSHFALLWDRVRVNRHQPQRYGSQGQCLAKGIWEPAPMEEPAQLGNRRRIMGLGSFEELMRKENTLCLLAPNQ